MSAPITAQMLPPAFASSPDPTVHAQRRSALLHLADVDVAELDAFVTRARCAASHLERLQPGAPELPDQDGKLAPTKASSRLGTTPILRVDYHDRDALAGVSLSIEQNPNGSTCVAYDVHGIRLQTKSFLLIEPILADRSNQPSIGASGPDLAAYIDDLAHVAASAAEAIRADHYDCDRSVAVPRATVAANDRLLDLIADLVAIQIATIANPSDLNIAIQIGSPGLVETSLYLTGDPTTLTVSERVPLLTPEAIAALNPMAIPQARFSLHRDTQGALNYTFGVAAGILKNLSERLDPIAALRLLVAIQDQHPSLPDDYLTEQAKALLDRLRTR